MRPTIREIVAAFARPFAFVPFFALLLSIGSLVGLLERTVTCFPVTVITSDRGLAEAMAGRANNCRATVEVEKFMIESPIFNDIDLPPVRDIFFVTLETDYAAWEEIQRTPDAIAEMNPFLKRVADLYLAGRLKIMIIAFVTGVVTAVLTFPFAFPRRSPFRRLDLAAASTGWGLLGLLSFGVAFAVPPLFLPTYLLTLAVGLAFAILLRVLARKLEK